MTKKQKITIASVAGACVLVLAAAIVCIVLFVGGGDGKTEPASVSTVSSLEELEETVPAQSDTENTQSGATESAAESETETVSQAEQTAGQSTAAQQATQATTPATTSTPAAATTPTTSTPASTTPPATSTGGTSNSDTSTGGSGSTGTSLEQQIAEFDARAPQIIQLAYQKLATIGVTAYPDMIDATTNCWAGTSDPAPWQDWDVSMDLDNDRCAEEFVELIQSMWELDGRKITGVQIEYLGVNYGTYQDNRPTFRVYNWQ